VGKRSVPTKPQPVGTAREERAFAHPTSDSGRSKSVLPCGAVSFGWSSTMGSGRGQEGKGSSPLNRIILYLATDRIPQRVAERNIDKGFMHNRNAPRYGEKAVTSVNQLSEALGYRNHSSMYPPKQRFPLNTEALIRSLYSIDERTECWKCFCNGDVEKFKVEYERLHAIATPAPQEAARVGVDAPDSVCLIPLQWDASADTRSAETRYASLTLRTGNSPPDPVPGQIYLGFDLHCPLDETDKVMTGLKRCFLMLDCGGGHVGPLSTRTGNGGGVEFDGARFSTYGTSITEPVWEIVAIGPGVIGKVESVPATFICIDHLKPRSSVKARIRAAVKEIQTTFVVPEGAAQSAAKRRIKERLVQLGIDGGEDGEVDLAMNEIIVKARSNVTDPTPES
jgi:hypothetical protein